MKNAASQTTTPPLHDDVMSAKQRLRTQARAARSALSTEQRAAASAAICARLRAHFEASLATTVSVYLASSDEANVDEFINWLLQHEICVLAPREHEFVPLESLELVRIGPWGVREPSAECGDFYSALDTRHSALILVPGLLFDRNGGRLGFGGGWYDRALARFPQALKVGIAFDEQIVESVPVEPHDVLMDAIVTPKTTVECSRFKVRQFPALNLEL